MVLNGGTVQANGYNVSVANLAGNVGSVVNGSAGGPASITLGCDNSTAACGALVANGGTASLALIKIGSGTQTLTGNNTYSGGTTINAGAIVSGARGLGTGTVNVGPGGTLAVAQTGSVGLAGQYFNIAAQPEQLRHPAAPASQHRHYGGVG